MHVCVCVCVCVGVWGVRGYVCVRMFVYVCVCLCVCMFVPVHTLVDSAWLLNCANITGVRGVTAMASPPSSNAVAPVAAADDDDDDAGAVSAASSCRECECAGGPVERL